MGKSLKNLHNNKQNNDSELKAVINNASSEDIRTAEAKAGKYKGMNENQLMSELMSKMNNAKGSGNFDESELDSFYHQMAPSLSNEQRNKMRSLINMLKQQ